MLTIGRDNTCDIVISDPAVSRIHASIEKNGDGFTYQDLSTNGTYVNGVLIHKSSVYVKLGDALFLAGKVLLPWDKVLKLFENQDYHSRNEKIVYNSNKDEQYEINRWNWGAFSLYPIWGCANGMSWTLIIALFFGYLFPIPNILFGIMGSRWAWNNKKWNSIEHFIEVQRQWKIWGIVLFIISLIAWPLLFLSILSYYM